MPMFVILGKSCFGDNDYNKNNNNNKINKKNLDSNNKYIKDNLISINRNSFQNNIINKYFNNIILIIKSFKLIINIYNKTTKMILNIINYNNEFSNEIFFLNNNYDRYFSLLNNNNNKNINNNKNKSNNNKHNTNKSNNNNNDKIKNKVNNNSNNMNNYKSICNCNQKNSEQYIFDDNMCYCRSKQYISNNNNNNYNNNKNINNNNIKKANCDLNKLYHSDNINIIKKNIINKNKKINNNNIVKKISNINILKSFKQKKSLHISIIFLLLLLQFKPTFVYGHNNNYNNDNSNNNNNQTIHELYSISSSTTTTTASGSAASTISTTSSAASLLDKTNQLNSPSSSSSSSAAAATTSHLTSFITRENTIRREPNLSYTTSGCHSCQLREQVKADNLASIKRHILLRLELKTLPNITSPIVPREIIEKFYKNHSIFNQNKNGDTKYNLNNNNNSNNNNRDKSTTGGTKRPINNNSPSYDSMQGDDPRTYIDYTSSSSDDDNNNNDNEDYEEEFFSIVNSLYVFPTMPRMRHNRKSDILHFSFTNNGHSSVSQAILHVYIRGKDWIYEYERSLLNNSDNISTNRQDIVITINRVLRRQNSQNSTHTQKISEIRQPIPNGMGKWITVDVTDMVSNWFINPNTNHGIVVKTLEQWMKPLVVSDDNPSNKAYALYIEILTKDNRKRRTKRNTSLNCSESDNEERCCRYPLEVDFRKFNWDWIVAPTSFNAYFCNGECKLGFLPKYPHTHIMQLSTAPQPCCSPTKMSAISLLYFNNDRNLVMSTIPNMAVDKCSCS